MLMFDVSIWSRRTGSKSGDPHRKSEYKATVMPDSATSTMCVARVAEVTTSRILHALQVWLDIGKGTQGRYLPYPFDW